MATWKISNYHKKNAVEVQHWQKDGKHFTYSEGFRWGSFTCESDTKPEVDLKNEHGWEPYAEDVEWDFDLFDDGCWGEFDFIGEWTDEEKEEIEELWEEEGYSGLEEAGWLNDDTEYFLHGPLQLENIDTGESWNGEDDSE